MPDKAPVWPVRWPAATLVIAALLTAGSIWSATSIEPEVDFVDTVPEHPGLEPYRRMLAGLDGVRFVAVYMAAADASLRGDAFDALVAEQEGLSAHMETGFPEGTFSHSLSVYEAMRTGNYMLAKMATAGNPPESAYSLPDDPVTWEAVKSQALDGDTLDDVLAQDGSSALMLFFLSTRDAAEARGLAGQVGDALAAWAADGDNHPVTEEHQPTGLLWASHVTDERNRDETLKWMPWVAAAVGLTLLWVVRRPSNALIAVVSLGCALAWTFGAMGLLGIKISFLTFILAPVVMGIGIDQAVHLLHRYEQERGDRDRRAAIDRAVRTTWPAITAAGLTTAAGIAVLGFVPAPLFAEIGLVAAAGIVLAVASALTVTPALRSAMPDWIRGARRDLIGPRLAALARPGLARPALAIIAILLITGAAAFVAQDTRIESGSAENEFPQDDPTIVLQHRIEDEYGAFQRAYLVVEGDMTDPDALAALHAAVQDASDLPLYRDASSVADLLLADEATDEGAVDIARAGILGAMGQQPDEDARLPQTASEARDRLDALHADPLWRGIVPFTITADYALAVVAIELEPWNDQAALLELRDALRSKEATLAAAIGPDHQVHAAGAPINRAAVIEHTPDDVGIATFGAAGAVGVLLAVGWARRGWHGLALAALAAGMVLVAALWLLASIPLLDGVYNWAAERGAPANSVALNHMFLLAFAITIAVGVDDLVHLAHRYWEARDAGRPRPAQEALRRAGRAITGTTATTFVAFVAMAGIYFLQSKNLAILTAAGVAYAYALTLLVATFGFRKTLETRAGSTGDARPV